MSAIEDSGNPVLIPKNDHEDATLISTSSPMVADFQAENTQNTIRDRVARFSATGTQNMAWLLPAARTCDSLMIFRHTAHGGDIQLDLYSDSGATALVWSSGPIPAIWYSDSDEYVWSTGSNDPFVSASPFRLYFDPVTFLSYRVTFSGTPTYFSYWQLSTLFLGRAYQFSQSAGFGFSMGVGDIADKNRSLGGSNRSNVSGTWRTALLDLLTMRLDERSTWLKVKEFCGTGRAFAWSLIPGDGTDLERDNMGLWKFTVLDPLVFNERHHAQRMQLEEC